MSELLLILSVLASNVSCSQQLSRHVALSISSHHSLSRSTKQQELGRLDLLYLLCLAQCLTNYEWMFNKQQMGKTAWILTQNRQQKTWVLNPDLCFHSARCLLNFERERYRMLLSFILVLVVSFTTLSSRQIQMLSSAKSSALAKRKCCKGVGHPWDEHISLPSNQVYKQVCWRKCSFQRQSNP